MFTEVAILDKTLTIDAVRQHIYTAISYLFDAVSILPFWLTPSKNYINDEILLGVPIDYPGGTSDTTTRNNAIISILKKGVNFVDIPINPHYLAESLFKKIVEDISTIRSITEPYTKTTIRFSIEYKLFEENNYFRVISLLKDNGFDTIISTAGQFIDDFEDNLIFCNKIEHKFGIKTVLHSHFWKNSQFETIKRANIYGVRFNKIESVMNVFDKIGVLKL